MTPVWQAAYPPGMRADFAPLRSTLVAEFDRALGLYADRPFIDFAGHTITFARFGAMVEAVARGMRAIGIAPGTHVALHLPNTPHYPIAFYAAARAGCVVVNLSPLDAEREIAHKLAIGEVGAVITFASIAGKLPQDRPGLRVIVCGPDDFTPQATTPSHGSFAHLLHGAHPPVEWPTPAPDDLAVLQFTGGTTGLPKAAMLSHANLTASADVFATWRTSVFTGDTRIITVLPLFHIYALTCILLPSIRKGDLMLLKPRWDTGDILETIQTMRPTTLPAVPTMYRALLSDPRTATTDFSSLRQCNSGGAPLPVELRDQFQALTGLTLLEGWGMSETCSVGTGNPVHNPKSGSAGVPLPGTLIEARALDDPRCVLPANEKGEIVIKGATITSGYYNNPEANAEAFVDGWFRTGDLGYLDDQGYVFLVDRRKDLIISGGFNVYPRLIEEAIYEYDGVEEVIVIGVPDTYRGECAKAFVKLREGAAAFTVDALKAFLADKVGRHEMPAVLEFRDALPKTPIGKLWKKPLVDEERAKAAAR